MESEYMICWTAGSQKFWEDAESRREVAAMLGRLGLDSKDSGVVILKRESDSEASILSVEDIFAAL